MIMTTATTTTLVDTLVKLENLYLTYQALLTEAQGQLESLSLGEQELKKVSELISDKVSFQRDISQFILFKIHDLIRDGDEELLDSWRSSRFMSMVSQKCLETIKNEVEPLIRDKVMDTINSGFIERMITNKVEASEKVETSLTVLNNLEAALKPIIAKQIEQ